MEKHFLCSLLVLTIFVGCGFTINQSEFSDIAVISEDDDTTTENTAVATTEGYYSRQSRYQRHNREGYVAIDTRAVHDDYQEEEVDHHDVEETKAMTQPKADYWGGYYDFLINEGSYKFWAVFQLATAALLIYSGFAALYYAKVNPQITEDYEDYLLRRRRRFVDEPPRDLPFFGLQPDLLIRILEAIATYNNH